RAMHNIPQQSLKWDCGPNSAARALTIAGKNITDYASFRSSCPRSHNPNKFGTVKKTGCAVAAMGMILAPFTGGVSTFAGIAAAHCTFATDSAIPDIGPSPSQLANYLSANLSGTLYKKAVHVGESDFAPFMCMIKEDIEIHKDPVILLLFYTWKAWHYVNVVGIQNETCDTFAILDTDGLIRLITKDSLKYLAHDDYLGDPSHWFSKGSIYRYNAIRFYK
ncbi:MAG: hypothetical protein K2X94_02585, partial [Amoebophilaceae bacterium]|nr:hypothetical protein [Amoebophilaceae bacterium]